jgi:hypothetical protein
MKTLGYLVMGATLGFMIGMQSCALVPCYDPNYPDMTNGGFKFTGKTPMGIEVDDPNHELDMDRVDAITKDVVACVKNIADHGYISNQEAIDAQCYGVWEPEIKSCLKVRVPEWSVSKCSGEQLFSCNVPDASCLQKGSVPTAECPCRCRAMIEHGAIVLTTPNLKLYPAYLVTMITGCGSPWTPTLAPCANPR